MNCTIYTMDINNKVFHLNLSETSSIYPRPFITFGVGLNDMYSQSSDFVLDNDSITNIFVTFFTNVFQLRMWFLTWEGFNLHIEEVTISCRSEKYFDFHRKSIPNCLHCPWAIKQLSVGRISNCSTVPV